jgi:hypothetical protein
LTESFLVLFLVEIGGGVRVNLFLRRKFFALREQFGDIDVVDLVGDFLELETVGIYGSPYIMNELNRISHDA